MIPWHLALTRVSKIEIITVKSTLIINNPQKKEKEKSFYQYHYFICSDDSTEHTLHTSCAMLLYNYNENVGDIE